ncbi:UNKNOWN [Stylonychia lemnae]|uniref:Uncharacterized protein n=1 Tax=Stylonychia lemnae TaxID=5949 RepID=A0A078ADS1_STYLE|nr:UNKNOWN [Stylonychia lemnae]|eukprot:CDW79682.1 UNKNOWN [Stylonychia lemnae]
MVDLEQVEVHGGFTQSFQGAFVAVMTFNCKQPKRKDLGCCGREKQIKQTHETKNEEIINDQMDPFQDGAQIYDPNIQVQGVYSGNKIFNLSLVMFRFNQLLMVVSKLSKR